MADSNPDIVRIRQISDLKLTKIKPADLAKIYIDEKGQEYKLRYDAEAKKVIIVKIIKSVLDGRYIKSKYEDKIEGDKQVEGVFKFKMGELSRKVLGEKYNLKFDADQPAAADGAEQPADRPEKPQPAAPEKPAEEPDAALKVDGIIINGVEDIYQVVEKVKARLEMTLKNIYESNIYNERYSYDDKVVIDEISRMIKNSIVEEFHNARVKFEDILKGYEDNRITVRMYNEQIKKIIASYSAEDRIRFLRDIAADETYIAEMEAIVKVFNDLEYKLSIAPETKVNARTYVERQKFNDAKITLNTCKNDVIRVLDFFKKVYTQKITPPGGA